MDNIAGTANNDTIIADGTVNAVLSAADTINGGAGTDTLKMYQKTADALETVIKGTITGIENIYINNGTLTDTKTLDVSSMSGVTSIALDSPAAMADSASFTVKTGTGQSVSLTKVVGTAAGATSTFKLDGASSATLNGVGTDLTVDLISTGTALSLTASGADSTITLTNTGAALATLNLAGDKALSVTTSAAALKTISSTATGDVTVNNTGGVVETYTGGAGKDTLTIVGANVKSVSTGAGNDKVTIATSALAAASAVDLGAGDDTLVLLAGGLANITSGSQLKGGDGTDQITTNEGASLTSAQVGKINASTGFEKLGFATTASGVDVSLLTSVNKFSVENTGTTTFTNAKSTSTFAIDNTAGVTAVSIGNAVGDNTSTITVDNQAGSSQTLATLTVTGITTVNLASTGKTGSANVITTLSNSDNSNVIVTGGTDLTITNALAGTTTGSKVDASAFTGKLSVIGSAKADVLIGGSGADTITGGDGVDTITTGAGADTVVLATAAVNRDVITDFAAGTGGDILKLDSGKANNTGHGASAAVAGDIVSFSTSGNLTGAAGKYIYKISVENVSSLSTDGASVLNALVTGTSSSGTITAANAVDILWFLVSDGTNVGVYRGAASGVTADTAITADEIALVGTLNSTTLANMTEANFTFVA